ncbi:MAG: NAD(P)-binding domain-containing protein, partial [Gammaproteobacteria bacterium]|nr:NAD(P)-binding domain-containing protein [Gammaproteobacteria bacterium]
MDNQKKLAFVGLGIMGYPMAGHLAAAGHAVRVYNRTAARADQWVGEHGGEAAPTPQEAARDADIVFMCVGNDDDVRSVTLGDGGVLAGVKRGAIVVDHTTASADLAAELAAEAAARGGGGGEGPGGGGPGGGGGGPRPHKVGGNAAP